MTAWILHRATGLGLALFVSLHILAALAMREFASHAGILINTVFEHWIFQVFIVFCALFHGLNGLRIVILDVWPGLIEYQREAIWLVWAAFLPSFGIAAYTIASVALQR